MEPKQVRESGYHGEPLPPDQFKALVEARIKAFTDRGYITVVVSVVDKVQEMEMQGGQAQAATSSTAPSPGPCGVDAVPAPPPVIASLIVCNHAPCW
ncbi:MAG: hypothetical protein WB723_03840 [Candidatus Acidiferrales bacterium]